MGDYTVTILVTSNNEMSTVDSENWVLLDEIEMGWDIPMEDDDQADLYAEQPTGFATLYIPGELVCSYYLFASICMNYCLVPSCLWQAS